MSSPTDEEEDDDEDEEAAMLFAGDCSVSSSLPC